MREEIVAAGTRPPVSGGETQAAAWVQRMFAGIAGRYDLLNHLLSFNIDRGWRTALERELAPVLQDPQAVVLDLCCGTGDLLLALERVGRARIVGADFCRPMLLEAQHKLRSRQLSNPLLEADALVMPLRDTSMDAITIGFGFRNLANYRDGLAELMRVLKPGGRLAILEFSHPRSPFLRVMYGAYSKLLLPLVGWLISGSLRAYTYLPASIHRFPRAPELAELLQGAGFSNVKYELLTGGIAALHTATKPVG